MVLTLGMAYWTVSLLVALFLLVCVVLILTVLIQRPQGGGLSGAFGAGGGGGGSGQTAFGARTGDALTWATIIMFVIYLIVAVFLNYAARPTVAPSGPPSVATPGAEVPLESIEDGETDADGAQAESDGETDNESSTEDGSAPEETVETEPPADPDEAP